MKKALFLAVAGTALLGGAAALPAAPAQKVAAAKDWTRTVAVTPEGGFRMGNPDAKVKLVEFGSLTCPHCADFAASAKAPLAEYVKTGKVSFEFRNFVLNGIDLTAALLARCGGAESFFRLTDDFFATQSQWVAKIGGASEAEKADIQALSTAQQYVRVADLGGLTQLAAKAGIAPAKARQCLADPAGLDRLRQMAEAADALGVRGTPTFLVNGALVHAHDWAELEPHIKSAGG